MNTTEVLAAMAATLPRLDVGSGADVYLSRYALHQRDDGGHVYLHRIRRADADAELHDHPWPFMATILSGGYIEERWVDGRRARTRRLPGASYNCDTGTFHRIAGLVDGDCWSLVATGPKAKSWSFWMPETGVVTPWRQFVENRA